MLDPALAVPGQAEARVWGASLGNAAPADHGFLA